MSQANQQQPVQTTRRKTRPLLAQTIGFSFLWLVSFGIMFVGSIMASTNFSWGENPHYQGKIALNLSDVADGVEPPIEKQEIVLGQDSRGIVEIYVLQDLPLNIIEGDTNINYIKIDGTEMGESIVFDIAKRYIVTYDAYIKYDMANILIRAGMQTLSLILIVFGVIWFVVEQNKKKDAQYLKEEDEIEQTSSGYLPIVWQAYEDSTNDKRKIKQWRAYCIKQENKLDRRGRLWSKKRIETYENHLRIWQSGTPEEKCSDSYCVKKSLLRLYQTDEWIKDNLKYKLVKYDPISYRLVFIGKDVRDKAENPNEYITKNAVGMVVIDNLPRLIIGLAVSIILTMLVIDIISFNITIVTGALLGLGNMAWNSYLSVSYGNNFFNNVTLGDICFRSGLAKEYKSYLTSHKGKEPELPKIAQKVEALANGSQQQGNPNPDQAPQGLPNDPTPNLNR